MSIIFGVRKSDGDVVEERQVLALARATDAWAPDGTFVQTRERIGMGFQPFHTHKRSSLESQPLIDDSGNMVTLDGRLDNYKELCDLLRIADPDTSDSLIVLTAFRHWGEECFAKFVGDWALVIWSHTDRSLYLARDHAGTRTLYFEERNGQLLWGTFLETFFAEKTARDLDDTYAVRYLTCEPVQDLTPYKGITAVTPAHYVVFQSDKVIHRSHWRWIATDQICYATDADYEEQFLALFRQSVERRTAPSDPILAQLSGGMDSSAIVCVSDEIRRLQGMPSDQLLDTISYFDDTEPNWNERPYFTAVETRRGKQGIHLSTSAWGYTFQPPASSYLFPGADSTTYKAELELERRIGPGRYRILLSGLGGDELLGGIPDPLPQLADCLVQGQYRLLMHQSLQWSLVNRLPLYRVLLDTVRYTAEALAGASSSSAQLPSWIDRKCYSRPHNPDRYRPSRTHLIGVLPSAVDSGSTWWSILESLPHRFPRSHIRHEYRYPLLDRDLTDFLLRVPPNQLLRPGERRSLMRRSLGRLLPPEVLQRRRKAYVIRGPLVAIRDHADAIVSLLTGSRLGTLPFVAEDVLRRFVGCVERGHTSEWRYLMRAVQLELWFKAV